MSDFRIVVQLLLSTIGLLLMVYFLAIAFKTSKFGMLVAISSTWILLGLFIVPILYSIGWIPLSGNVYMHSQSEFGIAASFHCLLLAVGHVLGLRLNTKGLGASIADAVVTNWPNSLQQKLVKTFIFISALSFFIYFYQVGFSNALINAAAARGGDFEAFSQDDKAFLFLKTIGSGALLGGSLLFYFLLNKNYFLVLVYLILLAAAYSNSISRTLILSGLIAPVVVYLAVAYANRLRAIGFIKGSIIATSLGGLSVIVVLYGKIFGHFLRSALSPSASDYDIVREGATEHVFNTFLSNYVFMWSSVDAGINHFFIRGPLFTPEPLLAITFGWLPVGALSALGLDTFYYGNLDETVRIACVNGANFVDGGCTVPPLMAGYSAYVLPFAGALIIGTFSGWIAGVIGNAWRLLDARNSGGQWILYYAYGLCLNFLTFIPSTMAYSVFFVIQFIFLTAALKIFVKIKLK